MIDTKYSSKLKVLESILYDVVKFDILVWQKE